MVRKKSYGKSIFREIKSTAGRFIAIAAIVALGVGFLVGLLSATPDMKYSIDRYYDENRTADIFIKSTMGITDGDIRAVSGLGGIKDVMPACVTDVLAETPDNSILTARIYGLSMDRPLVNGLTLTEGRMPEKAGECVAQAGAFESLGIGSKLRISKENDNYDDIGDIYAVTEFTVVGIVKNPFYFGSGMEPSNVGNGRLGTVLYTPRESYSLEFETDLYITLSEAEKENSFSDGYQDVVDEAADRLKSLGDERCAMRFGEIRSEAWRKLNSAKADYFREKTDAENKLSDAYGEIEDGREEIRKARDEIKENRQKLEDARASVKDGYSELEKAKEQLDASEEAVLNAKEMLSNGIELPPEVLAQIAAYDEGMAQYELGMEELKKNEKEIDSAFEELENGEKKLDEEEAKLLDGEEEYLSEKAKADEEFLKAEKEISDAEADITAIEEPEWYVLDRNSNVTYASYKINVQKVADIARVFPVFFFLVAALVSLTTMARMVEEERTQIGALKALGYSKSAIASKYLLYCGLATLIGCIVGVLAGFQLLPVAVNNAYATLYDLPKFYTKFNAGYALTSCALEILCTMGATWLSCRRILKEKPALLMRPKTPKAGKRILLEHIGFLWRRMSFSHKATCRNVFRSKGHLFMTVIGIAGCTALMLVGFGMKDSIEAVAVRQFGDIWNYDLTLNIDGEAESSEVKDFLSKNPFTAYYEENGKLRSEDKSVSVIISVPENENGISDFISIHDRKTGTPIALENGGAVITEKAAEVLSVKAGDTVILENADNRRQEFRVIGITENYVGSYVYMTGETYKNAWGEAPDYDRLLVRLGDEEAADNDLIAEKLLACDEITGVSFTSDLKKTYDNLLTSVNYIVWILTAAAGGLAAIVLYNLTNININERIRELAALRVLGYHHSEVAGYIYREIAILSVLGTGAGLILGTALHKYVLYYAESAEMMFGKIISPMSFILAAAATLAFSAIVDLLMSFKIRRIQMVESMKAID